jgi:hypothetical protein
MVSQTSNPLSRWNFCLCCWRRQRRWRLAGGSAGLGLHSGARYRSFERHRPFGAHGGVSANLSYLHEFRSFTTGFFEQSCVSFFDLYED